MSKSIQRMPRFVKSGKFSVVGRFRAKTAKAAKDEDFPPFGFLHVLRATQTISPNDTIIKFLIAILATGEKEFSLEFRDFHLPVRRFA